MIVVMKSDATPDQVEKAMKRIESLGLKPHPIHGVERTVIGAVGDERGKSAFESLIEIEGVENVIPILKPFKLASRELKSAPSEFKVGPVQIGGKGFALIAGPCSVESEEQILEIAREVKAKGANMLRGGAFKPRTSPYSFQGLEDEGLKLLAKAREETGLPIVTEVLSSEDVERVAEFTDVLQVGARNMQNYSLLKKLGKADRAVLLKRGMMCTIKETLMAAEYMVHPVNGEVPPVKGRPRKLPHYANRGKTSSSRGELASARSCFSTVRTALGKLRITGLLARFDVARSFPQFPRPLLLQPTILTSERGTRFGIRKAPNHVPTSPFTG